jgi:NAD-dependent dihydropyrimidine dehydrogenase PreA subunit
LIVMPEIDPERCNGCGLCVDACKCRALILDNNIVIVIETEDCGWCLSCETVCPTGAISCPFEIIIEDS